MKMLIADDDVATRTVLRRILEGYGEVHTCADGDEALQACRQALEVSQAYDLICLDLQMPNLDGLEALRRIRKEEHNHGCEHASKIIIATASDDDSTVSAAFSQLCDAYIVKPIDPVELVNLLYCLCPVPERD
jgi:two-component system chemotaxis response regulator CheY